MRKCEYCGGENDDVSVACCKCGQELEVLPAPAPLTDLLDPAFSPVIVATFSSLQEASLLADRLEAAGIEAFIPEEFATQVFSAVIPLERLTVRVAAKDHAAAMAVVSEQQR